MPCRRRPTPAGPRSGQEAVADEASAQFRRLDVARCRRRGAHTVLGRPHPTRRADRRPVDRARAVRPGRTGLAAHLSRPDRKSTRLNSSHLVMSYAVFCLKKKNKQRIDESAHMYISLEYTMLWTNRHK